MSLHSQPILSMRVRLKPWLSPAMSSSEMSFAPRPSPVRTATVIQSARMPEVMKIFSPSTT